MAVVCMAGRTLVPTAGVAGRTGGADSGQASGPAVARKHVGVCLLRAEGGPGSSHSRINTIWEWRGRTPECPLSVGTAGLGRLKGTGTGTGTCETCQGHVFVYDLPKLRDPGLLHHSTNHKPSMGIRNLIRWIQWVRPLHPMTATEWEAFRDKRVGVDILGFMYRAKTEGASVLEVLAALVRSLRAWGIQPVFVFDGKSPREKDGTRSSRRRQKAAVDGRDPVRITTEDRNAAKQLFYALGVLCLNAELEADEVLAFLARRGDFAAVISADMDFLPRGVGTLIIPNTLADLTTWRAATLLDLLETAHLTYTNFVDMCVLLGCDYAPTIPTISYQFAYWRIREARTMLEILAHEGIRTATAWETAAALLRGDKTTWETMLSDKQREKWAAGPPPAEPTAAILQGLGPQ